MINIKRASELVFYLTRSLIAGASKKIQNKSDNSANNKSFEEMHGCSLSFFRILVPFFSSLRFLILRTFLISRTTATKYQNNEQ